MKPLRQRAIDALMLAVLYRGNASLMRDHLAVAVESIILEAAAEAELRAEAAHKAQRAALEELEATVQALAEHVGKGTP